MTTEVQLGRKFRPRATASLAVAPVAITDRSAPATVGLESDVFRVLVQKLRIRHVLSGRRMIVLASDFAEAIERAGSADVAELAANDDAPAASVDALLARLGRRRAV
jgi:hypothetical protein